MTCPNCRRTGLSGTAAFCIHCSFALERPSTALPYASFLRRLGAFWIDVAVLTFLIAPLALILVPPTSAEQWEADLHPFSLNPRAGLNMFNRLAAIMVFNYVMVFLYQALMTCSRWQGSVGKRLLGLRVVDTAGRRLQLPRAALREACRIFSVIPIHLGFIWILVNPQRRGFHDLLAGTAVLYDATQAKIGGAPAAKAATPPPLPPLPGPPVRAIRQQPPPIPKQT